MNASNLLHSLSADGFSLHIVDGGRLSVTPAARLTDQLRFLIRQHRDALVDLLSARTPPLATVERHAITERQTAEPAMRVFQALIAMPDGQEPRWLVYLSPGSTLAEAYKDLVSKFGVSRVLRVIDRNGGLEINEVAA